MKPCKRFFTAEVHEGVKATENLDDGTTDFEGENDITKPNGRLLRLFHHNRKGEKAYDKFMTLAQIVERANFSPQFKSGNYKQTSNNVHYEKLVVQKFDERNTEKFQMN